MVVVAACLVMAAYIRFFYQPRQVDNGYARLSRLLTKFLSIPDLNLFS
ncbi:MAG: hypothetical protein JWM28_3937 [Chitinophagaceae bacterium]|nr:hypothetical protein [Chitinophagaceae bacterium]